MFIYVWSTVFKWIYLYACVLQLILYNVSIACILLKLM